MHKPNFTQRQRLHAAFQMIPGDRRKKGQDWREIGQPVNAKEYRRGSNGGLVRVSPKAK